MYSRCDATVRAVPLAFDVCIVHINHAPYRNSSKKRSPYGKRERHRIWVRLSRHVFLYHLSVPFNLFMFLLYAEFAEVMKCLTQLEDVMFPHLDSMGLGFGSNIFLNMTGSMCWFYSNFYFFVQCCVVTQVTRELKSISELVVLLFITSTARMWRYYGLFLQLISVWAALHHSWKYVSVHIQNKIHILHVRCPSSILCLIVKAVNQNHSHNLSEAF